MIEVFKCVFTLLNGYSDFECFEASLHSSVQQPANHLVLYSRNIIRMKVV